MVVFISTSYFSIKEQSGIKILKKYWWKNSIIQIIRYNSKDFLVATIGYGKANAAMTTTYLIEKYKNISSIINIDLALSTKEKLVTSDVTISTKFIYRDVDQTIFENMKYGQVLNETESFQFKGNFAQKLQNLKLGLLESVIGTGEVQIYNVKQFKELIEKYGDSIDVIDEEAGAVAQVLKKTNINFVSLKVIYNNALSQWENDPKHRYKMYEVTNTFKFLIKRLFNFLSSKYEYVLLKANKDTIESINTIIESERDEWVSRLKSDTVKVESIGTNSVVLVDDNIKDPMLVEFGKIKGNEKQEEIEEEQAKIILGIDEWKYAPTRWQNRLPIIENVKVNDDELVWNRSAKLSKTIKKYKIELLSKKIAEFIINNKSSNVTYETHKIEKKSLVIFCDANVSFYISDNNSHELIDDHKFGISLVKNEFVKFLNIYLKDIKMKFNKIHIYVNVPASFNHKIQIFIKSDTQQNRNINFGKVNSTMQKEYTIVDNARDDYDIQKVGTFKVSIKLKNKNE